MNTAPASATRKPQWARSDGSSLQKNSSGSRPLSLTVFDTGLSLPGCWKASVLSSHSVSRPGDVVGHDRGDHLVGAGARLEQTDDAAPQAAGDDAGQQCERHLHDAGAVHGEAHPHRRHAAGEHLARGADVEQAGSGGDGEAQAGEDQRCRRHDGLADAAEAAERARGQRDVGVLDRGEDAADVAFLEAVDVGEADDERTDDQRRHDREEGEQQVVVGVDAVEERDQLRLLLGGRCRASVDGGGGHAALSLAPAM